MLHGGSHEAIAVSDGKLIHRLSPLLGRASPISRDVAQRQPDQFGGRIFAGEVPARLDDLAQARVDALEFQQGFKVITMDMMGKIGRMWLRDQLSFSEIVKRTGLSRNTVKKWLKAPGDVVPKYGWVKFDGMLTAFEPAPRQALTDSHRPKQGRRSGRALFAQIQAQGYRGGYGAVTGYLGRWRVESAANPAKAFFPMSFELGEAFQFDWSVEAMVVGGVFYNLQVAQPEALRQSSLLAGG